jgi:hypothetical protein
MTDIITQFETDTNFKFVDKSNQNLYYFFNNFTLCDKYPFIQYCTNDGNMHYKFKESLCIDNKLLAEWVDNISEGISIKVKSDANYSSIYIDKNGIVNWCK